jgi:hypothetical protein
MGPWHSQYDAGLMQAAHRLQCPQEGQVYSGYGMETPNTGHSINDKLKPPSACALTLTTAVPLTPQCNTHNMNACDYQ